MTAFRHNAVLSPALSCRIDEREHCLKQSVGADPESYKSDTRKKGFDSNRVFVSKDEDRSADSDDCADYSDDE